MVVFLLVFRQLLPLVFRALPFDVNPFWILLENSLRSLHFVYAAVRTRGAAIVIEVNHLPIGGVDEADVDISKGVFLPGFRMIGTELFGGIKIQPARRSAH